MGEKTLRHRIFRIICFIGACCYAFYLSIRPHAFKDESDNIQEAAKKMRDMVDKIWVDVITPESKVPAAEEKKVVGCR